MLFLILLLIVVGLPIVIAICSSKGRDYPRDYGTTRRVMHRITLRGDRPCGP